MILKSVVLYFAIYQITGKNAANIIVNNSNCETVCATSGAKAHFEAKNKLCKCLMPNNVDDTDIALVMKNGKLIEKAFTDQNIVVKRETSHETASPNEVTAAENSTTLSKESDPNTEAIVGQQGPLRRLHLHRTVAQRRQPDPRPITQEQQKHILRQIRDHLNRLEQTSEKRTRQYEIDASEGLLRQLAQSKLVQTQPVRSRLRNVVEESRKRQQKLLQSVRLGAAKTADESAGKAKGKDEVETAVKEMSHHKAPQPQVITQPANLVEDER